jgi:hypothetical protein
MSRRRVSRCRADRDEGRGAAPVITAVRARGRCFQTLFAAATVLLVWTAAPAYAQWRTETVAGPMVDEEADGEPLRAYPFGGLSHDRQGRALALFLRTAIRGEESYSYWALAVRDPAGTWQPEQRIGGRLGRRSQTSLHTYGATRMAIFGARWGSAGEVPSETVVAYGHSDGRLSEFHPFDGETAHPRSRGQPGGGDDRGRD